MHITFVTHSLRSCWNHGNAHFLRGVIRALLRRGHRVTAWEPEHGWSAANLVADHGEVALHAWAQTWPEFDLRCHRGTIDADAIVDGADAVIVHEWNDPALVAAIGRAPGRRLTLFHDTHHRAVSDPDAIRAFDLSRYDGVLAFGASLAEAWRRLGWGGRAFVWHEAADLSVFHPPPPPAPAREGVVWIGNWGDGERGAAIETLLLAPARAAGLPVTVHGVRYPEAALDALRAAGADFRGWAPNAAVPEIFARHRLTVHLPRRFYAETLPGIPTIRVFEALACGIPLICAPWNDAEHLFTPGEDFLMAEDGAAMARHMRALAADPALAAAIAASGLTTVRARHGCDHRAAELETILAGLGAPATKVAVPCG